MRIRTDLVRGCPARRAGWTVLILPSGYSRPGGGSIGLVADSRLRPIGGIRCLPEGRRVTLLSICPRCGRLFPADRGEVCPECGFPLTVHLDRRLAQLEPG